MHQKTPEDHPMYAKEWKKFWAHRYKELKVEGKVNPSDYDYKPEWVDFWMKRMKEILVETIEDKKIEIRMELKLPFDYEESLNDSTSDSSIVNHENSRKRAGESIANYEEISSASLSDDSESSYQLPPKHYRRSSSRDFFRYRESSSVPSQSTSTFEDNNESVTVVSICRLLSALESELGSLSHKVLDLLSKAIALEKLKANSSDELLMTTENSVFLETVKEKMKGLLMIGALTPNKAAAIKKCIQNIAKLIYQTPVKDVKIEDEPKADKKLIMEVQVAEALRACGKEDFTAEELEVLVEMCLEVPTTKVVPLPVETPPKLINSTSNMNLLTDADLKILLDNFTDLVKNEQDEVIQFLSSLEKTEPMRVEALRQHVTMADETGSSNNVIIDLDDDSDDYNINETITSVLTRVENSQDSTHDEPSLSDNLLTFGQQHQMYKFY